MTNNTETTAPKAPPDSGVSAGAALLAVAPGLTLRHYDIDVNVHFVLDGSVFWAMYYVDNNSPATLHQAPIEHFTGLMNKAIENGAAVFCWLENSEAPFARIAYHSPPGSASLCP